MPRALPTIGERESQDLEFKRAEALRTPEGRRQILRAIVGMMNARKAGPGVIWVGVAEKDDCVERLDVLGDQDVGSVRPVRDAILDAIEPNPSLVIDPDPRSDAEADVVLERFDAPEGGWLLRIEVKPRGESRPPACLRSGNQREFLVRAGARTASISYEALFESSPVRSLGRVRGTQVLADRTAVAEAHEKWVKGLSWASGLAVSVVPIPDRDPPDEVPRGWIEMLRSPPPDLSRPQGWTWYAGATPVPKVRQGPTITGGVADRTKEVVYRHFRIEGTGRLHFFTDLESLTWQPQSAPFADEIFPGHRGQIGPLCLVETVASVIRLGWKLLHTDTGRTYNDERVGAVVSLQGALGWLLPLGKPGRVTLFFRDRAEWAHFDRPEILSGPVILRRSGFETLAQADSLAYSLLQGLYESDPESREIAQGAIPWFSEDRQFIPRS